MDTGAVTAVAGNGRDSKSLEQHLSQLNGDGRVSPPAATAWTVASVEATGGNSAAVSVISARSHHSALDFMPCGHDFNKIYRFTLFVTA